MKSVGFMETYYQLRAQFGDGSSAYGLFDIKINGPQTSVTAVVRPQKSPEDLGTVVVAAFQDRKSFTRTALPSDPKVIVAAFQDKPEGFNYINSQKPSGLPETVNLEGKEVSLFEFDDGERRRCEATQRELLK